MQLKSYRLPAEWEPHSATFISWPALPPAYALQQTLLAAAFVEAARLIADYEPLHILHPDTLDASRLTNMLEAAGVDRQQITLHAVEQTYWWLRDSGPTAVAAGDGSRVWLRWQRPIPAHVPAPFGKSTRVPETVAAISKLPIIDALQKDGCTLLHLEGGAFDSDGDGTLIVTEECLLQRERAGRPEPGKAFYEELLSEYLGAKRIVWLLRGCAGDPSRGHVDNVARFLAPGILALAWEANPSDCNHLMSIENLERAEQAADAAGRSLTLLKIPMPRPVYYCGSRVAASYLNFYIVNDAVLVPTFNDPADAEALYLLRDAFPDRTVIGIYARELAASGGALHCMTQPLPQASDKFLARQ